MIIYRDIPKDFDPHYWFAWYPVWTWETKEMSNLMLVWLQDVWREKGTNIKYRHYLTKP